MMSEQTVLSAATRTVTSRPSASAIGRTQLGVAGEIVQRSMLNMRGWLRVPALPYAALWEGAVVAGMLHEPKDFEPDPFASESPLVKDSWPRG